MKSTIIRYTLFLIGLLFLVSHIYAQSPLDTFSAAANCDEARISWSHSEGETSAILVGPEDGDDSEVIIQLLNDTSGNQTIVFNPSFENSTTIIIAVLVGTGSSFEDFEPLALDFVNITVDCSFTFPNNTGSTIGTVNRGFLDGRINNFDDATPIVVYGQDFGNGRGLVIYSDDGAFIMAITPEDIASVPDCPTRNVLIRSYNGVSVSRLSNCHFQINALMTNGKLYVLRFLVPYAGTGYTSFEIE